MATPIVLVPKSKSDQPRVLFQLRSSDRPFKLKCIETAGLALLVVLSVVFLFLIKDYRPGFLVMLLVFGYLFWWSWGELVFLFKKTRFGRYTVFEDSIEWVYDGLDSNSYRLPFLSIRAVSMSNDFWDKLLGVVTVSIHADLQGMVVYKVSIEDGQRVYDLINDQIRG